MKLPQLYYTLRNMPVRGFVRMLMWLGRILPEKAAYAMARCLADVLYFCHRSWRKTALRNLELLLKDELTHLERLRIFRNSVRHLGYNAIEFIRLGAEPVADALKMIAECEGEENLTGALAQGKGVIALTMHYGNWELVGVYVSLQVSTMHAVGKAQRDDYFTNIAFPWRKRFGLKNIISGDKMSSAILRALKGGEVLGLVADQNGGSTGTFAPFAGIQASTVMGPAALALKTGAPLVLIICRRLSPGKHRIIVKPPMDVSGLPHDRQAARVEILTRMNKQFEDILREDPSQWLLGHKRWKTRPPGESWLY